MENNTEKIELKEVNSDAKKKKNGSKTRTIRRVITFVVVIAALIFAFGYYQSTKTNEPTDKSSDGSEVTKIGEQEHAPSSIDAVSASFPIRAISENGKVVEIKPNDDAVRIDIFFDPMCPYCAMAHQEIKDDLSDRLKDGSIDVYFTPVAFLDAMSSDEYSTRAINAFIEISDQSPEHALPFLDEIFDADFQPGENESYKPVSNEDLAKIAQKIGVSKEVTDSFDKMNFEKWIKESADAQMNRKDIFEGPFSTPAFFAGLSYETGSTIIPERIRFKERDKMSEEFNAAIQRIQDQ